MHTKKQIDNSFLDMSLKDRPTYNTPVHIFTFTHTHTLGPCSRHPPEYDEGRGDSDGLHAHLGCNKQAPYPTCIQQEAEILHNGSAQKARYPRLYTALSACMCASACTCASVITGFTAYSRIKQFSKPFNITAVPEKKTCRNKHEVYF